MGLFNEYTTEEILSLIENDTKNNADTTLKINEEKEEKVKELNDNVFYSPEKFSELRGCNIDTARTIFNIADFPSEN